VEDVPEEDGNEENAVNNDALRESVESAGALFNRDIPPGRRPAPGGLTEFGLSPINDAALPPRYAADEDDSPGSQKSPSLAAMTARSRSVASEGSPHRASEHESPLPPTPNKLRTDVTWDDDSDGSRPSDEEECVLEKSLEVSVRGGSELAELRSALAVMQTPESMAGSARAELTPPRTGGLLLLKESKESAPSTPGIQTLAHRIMHLPLGKREALLKVLADLEG
jgi:hypothetical protein